MICAIKENGQISTVEIPIRKDTLIYSEIFTIKNSKVIVIEVKNPWYYNFLNYIMYDGNNIQVACFDKDIPSSLWNREICNINIKPKLNDDELSLVLNIWKYLSTVHN